MTKKQKYVCPNCSYDVTNLANWETFLDQQTHSIHCSGCGVELILHFEEFLGEAEEYIEFYFLKAEAADL
jgi:DNA-directed RNA polymerase subunit RPC12/RpoP